MRKSLIQLMFIAIAFSAAMTSCNDHHYYPYERPYRPQRTTKTKQPPFLQKGDKVALVSPSYFTPMENVDKAVELIKEWGFEPVVGPNVGKTDAGKYAGTVSERKSDMLWALNDNSIKAIICNRGGYGSLQIVDNQLMQAIAEHPKWISGYSDISSLHGAWQNAGLMSIHGTMSASLAASGNDPSSTLFRDLIQGKVPRYELPSHEQNITGKAQGMLVGGNICTLTPAIGTLADDLTGKKDIILFIEEVEESMHNIDRQFNILKSNGVLDHCTGVILGEFTDCGNEFTYGSVEAMLRQQLLGYNIPLLCGFPAGHDDVNLPLIMGANVTLDVRTDGATLQFDVDGEQQTVQTQPIVEQAEQEDQEKNKTEDSSQFTMLTDAVPDAILEIRYYGTYNFVGDRIDGYLQPTALLTKEAADSLRAVSDDVNALGYRLKIYDAYRPQMAVDHFVRWAADVPDTRMKQYFYPDLDKSVLFEQDYIMAKSGHTRGSTVDLTLFDKATEKELDMGGTFDWFGPESHPDFCGNPDTGEYTGDNSKSPAGRSITPEQFANRMILRNAMLRHGFKPLDSEWWHFTLRDEPFPDTYFTFPVEQIK